LAIEIHVGGKTIQANPIESGKTESLGFDSISDSGLQMRYRLEGDATITECQSDVYVTTGLRQHLVATIEADKSCRVEEK